MNRFVLSSVLSAVRLECALREVGRFFMPNITANDLKIRGIAAIEASLADGRTEAVVSVRGAERYVVMELAQYQYLRECELEAALAESRSEIAAGRFVVESPAEHLARVQALIASEAKAETLDRSKTATNRSPVSALRKPANTRLV